jgi:thiol-disulfide isomerase/thioredoxin
MNASNDDQSGSVRSRRLLLGGAAALATLAGAGWAWWRLQPRAVDAGATDDLWSRQFDQPAGGVLTLQSFRGRPLLINFWATWCPPCVEELPLLDTFHREQQPRKTWQVVGLAIDQPSAVRTFLARMPLAFPVGLAGLDGMALNRALGNPTGGLPFSVALDAAGSVVQRKIGKLSAADLQALASLG